MGRLFLIQVLLILIIGVFAIIKLYKKGLKDKVFDIDDKGLNSVFHTHNIEAVRLNNTISEILKSDRKFGYIILSEVGKETIHDGLNKQIDLEKIIDQLDLLEYIGTKHYGLLKSDYYVPYNIIFINNEVFAINNSITRNIDNSLNSPLWYKSYATYYDIFLYKHIQRLKMNFNIKTEIEKVKNSDGSVWMD